MLVYVPWIFVFFGQTMKVKRGFWIPPASFPMIVGAFTYPFAHKNFYPPPAFTTKIMFWFVELVKIFGVIFVSIKKSKKELIFIFLCLFAFAGALVTAIIVSKIPSS